MSCKDLGGICDLKFKANTFEAIAEKARKHGTDMAEKGDKDHLSAMEKMKEMMENPDDMESWMQKKQQEFDALPETE